MDFAELCNIFLNTGISHLVGDLIYIAVGFALEPEVSAAGNSKQLFIN